MSWVRVYIHLVFTTKNREPYLNTFPLRRIVFRHIKQNAEEKNIRLDCVNGWTDHVHCLISLGSEQSISKVAQLIKGESAFWINQNKLTNDHFSWQDDYWATAVCESRLKRVRKYIHRQEEHHSLNAFDAEIEA